MTESEVTFHNKTDIRTQAQIFEGQALISTCVVDPGETYVLPARSERYDIFFKNGVTGWELARKLDSEDKIVTLRRHEGRYIVTAG